ncbi:hypothetical protein PC120_g8171 [Phytophthora cactorum]|nr:hypothetical protein PC120_g8171 [Phytophthora cactorum]KAG3091074.1 hypothetical protein PC122_g7152 [Phytophthora cactorum]
MRSFMRCLLVFRRSAIWSYGPSGYNRSPCTSLSCSSNVQNDGAPVVLFGDDSGWVIVSTTPRTSLNDGCSTFVHIPSYPRTQVFCLKCRIIAK